MPKFCHNCGKEAQILWKACPYCETSFSSLTNRPPAPAAPPSRPDAPYIAHVDREDSDDSYIDRAGSLSEILKGRRIGRLDVDVVKPYEGAKETVGSVYAQAKSPTPEIVTRAAPYQNVDGQAFLKDFQKEAGTRGQGVPSPETN